MLTKRLSQATLAVAITVAAGVVDAGLFTIVPVAGSNQEAAGQASGVQYPYPGGPGPGAGLPTTDSSPNSWPVGPGFATEPGFGQGISGFDTSYLYVNQAHWVTFQFMGGGNSTFQNSFWIDLNGAANPGGWVEMFQDSHGGPTNPCPISLGSALPACDKIAPGLPDGVNLSYNQYTIFLPAGLIPFQFDLGGSDNTVGGPFAGPINSPGTAWTSGIPLPGATQYASATGNPADGSGFPGYFLGIDPYSPYASAPFQTTGDAAYIGLADRPRCVFDTTSCVVFDHDYQDMVIRVVPEPGSLLLLGGALIALAGLRRRKA